MALTASDLAAVASMFDAKIKAALATPLLTVPAAPVAAPVSQESVTVVLETGSEVSSIKEWTPEQLAADTVDPAASVYTRLVREKIHGVRQGTPYWAIWEPMWRAERDRLAAAGLEKRGENGANKRAAHNIAERVKLEKARLAQRDGGSAGMAPVMSAQSRRSSGTHSDPTANQAIGNVTRAERLAALKAEMDQLMADDSVVEFDNGTLATGPKKSLTRSAAQKRAGTNPYQYSIDKLVRDAQASKNQKQFVLDWARSNVAKSPTTAHLVKAKATKALEALGYTVKA